MKTHQNDLNYGPVAAKPCEHYTNAMLAQYKIYTVVQHELI